MCPLLWCFTLAMLARRRTEPIPRSAAAPDLRRIRGHVSVTRTRESRNHTSQRRSWAVAPTNLFLLFPTMSDIVYRPYVGESDLPYIMALVQSELSEPYVIYTFRYFLHQW